MAQITAAAFDWSRMLRPEIFGMLIPICGFLVAGIVIIVKMLIVHRERMALIEQGMHPDLAEDEAPPEEGAPSET